ncbi:unnamed protein product [Paramecium pentaurelia]|uniref:Uncharacterized protein n=1 Tax=Paramecium pentaurelia TaxID=43138 RepID=A0A8S1UKA2_9CILI|nr:unnamed protein product [Paramecium pentaurelia]
MYAEKYIYKLPKMNLRTIQILVNLIKLIQLMSTRKLLLILLKLFFWPNLKLTQQIILKLFLLMKIPKSLLEKVQSKQSNILTYEYDWNKALKYGNLDKMIIALQFYVIKPQHFNTQIISENHCCFLINFNKGKSYLFRKNDRCQSKYLGFCFECRNIQKNVQLRLDNILLMGQLDSLDYKNQSY